MKKSKLLKGKTLTNKLDQVIRDIFKLLYGDNPTCFVCDRMDGWYSQKDRKRGIQVGHFIGRSATVTRWFLPNLFPQCSGCNKYHNDNPAPFTAAIIRKVGEKRLLELNDLAAKYRGVKIPESARREHYAVLLEIKSELEQGHLLTDGMLYANVAV